MRQMIGDAGRTLKGVQIRGQFFNGSEIAQAVIDVYELTRYWMALHEMNTHPPNIKNEHWAELFQGVRRGIEDLHF